VTVSAWPDARPDAADAWVGAAPSTAATRLRLFCFPYAGGGASIFRAWREQLPPSVDVRPVQLPGRENRLREQPFRRMDELVLVLTRVLAPMLELPFAFFGHSMGALTAFELARALRRRGLQEPVALFVSGHRAPHIPDTDPPIHALEEGRLVEELERLNGTPAAVLADEELRQLVLPSIRADFEVCETYAYADDDPFACPIHAFGGLADRKASQPQLEPWRRYTRGAFTLEMLPGDHFFVVAQRAALVDSVARKLNAALRRELDMAST
jgi:surfactin synthase thioesterase subunit